MWCGSLKSCLAHFFITGYWMTAVLMIINPKWVENERTVRIYMAHYIACQFLCQFRPPDENLLWLIGSHRHTQQEGNRNQSMNIPLQSLSGSYASNLCHLYFCSHPQSPLHRFVCVFLQRKIQSLYLFCKNPCI